MVFNDYQKERIVYYHRLGFKAPTIKTLLATRESIYVSREGIHKFLEKYVETGCLNRRPGSGRPFKITAEIRRIVEQQMRLDDETSAYQLHGLLVSRGYSLSIQTILRCRAALGWTFRGSAYCQLIGEENKQKRLDFVHQYKDDPFDNVIYTDECTVQLETHRRFCCRKKGETPRPKPRPKHPLKVHVWAGISKQGSTGICIFDGIMDKELYVEILDRTLLPFIHSVFPNGHRFMADNDPKHTSRFAQDYLKANNVYWWRTPAESPDLNPIENLWHELKEYIRREIKPKTKTELVEGIKVFWRTVDQKKCIKYIQHLKKVIPKVIELGGAATGY